MSVRVYVVAHVPAEAREAAEAAVQPLLASPNEPGVYTFSVPLVPYPGPADAEPTAYGVCAPFLDDYIGALAALSSGIPGTAYKVVSPWRDFVLDADWTGWLQAGGYQPQVIESDGP